MKNIILIFFFIAIAAAVTRPPGIPTYKIDGIYFNATFFNTWIYNQAKSGTREVGVYPGKYQVYAGYNFESYPIQFYNVKDLKVWMDGVQMVFMNVNKPGFLFNNCVNVTLIGVTTSYNETPYGQAKITSITKASDTTHYIDMDIPTGFSTRWWKTILSSRVVYGYVFNPDTKQPYMPNYKVEIYPLEATTRNNNDNLIRWKIDSYYVKTSSNLPNLHIGDWVIIRGESGGFHLLQSCERISYIDVTVLQGGFALISEGGIGGHTFDGMVITYGPDINGVPQLVSTAGDGLHVGTARVGPTIKNCRFEGMQDDGINIYNYFTKVSSISGNNVVLNRVGGGVDEVWKVGDSLRCYKGANTLVPVGYVTIGAIVSDNGSDLSVRLSDSSFIKVGDTCSNTAMNSNGFLITNNTIRNHRARGILVKGSNGVISYNRLSKNSLGGIILLPEQGYFLEADYSVNVTIIGNYIDSVNYVGENYGSISLFTGFNSGVAVAETNNGFSNIIISQNQIINSFGNAIRVNSATNITIDQNDILPGPFDAGFATISLNSVNQVSVTSNCVKNTSFPIAKYLETTNVTGLTFYCSAPTSQDPTTQATETSRDTPNISIPSKSDNSTTSGSPSSSLQLNVLIAIFLLFLATVSWIDVNEGSLKKSFKS